MKVYREMYSNRSVDFKNLKILHVTEALGGGVLYLLHQITNAQVAAGFEVILVHSNRPDTPDSAALNQLFPPPITRIVLPMTTNISLKQDWKALLALLKIFKSTKPEIIHLHSSKAGVLGRVAARMAGLKNRSFYSPHGFSFLRQDVSLPKRRLFFIFEYIAGIFGDNVITSCKSEGELARKLVGSNRVSIVVNCSDATPCDRMDAAPGKTVKVMSAGRLCYQKAPWRFWDLSSALSDENASFQWIGDGEFRDRLEDKAVHPKIEISGWVDRNRLWKEMQQADILVMTSLWEGMPLILLDAQAIGLPAIVPDVVGCRDAVIDGVTGFICQSDAIMIERTRELIRNAALRAQMAEAARTMAKQRFSIARMHRELVNVYTNHISI